MGFIILSGLSTRVSTVTQLFAVQRASLVIVAPILATFPLWTQLLSKIFIAHREDGADHQAQGCRLEVGNEDL